MKRKGALLLALLMMLQLLPWSAQAEKVVYFLATEETVQPLSDSTMPFWSGGYLYIPSTAFKGSTRESVGVSSTYNAAKKLTVFYDREGRALYFDHTKNCAEDLEGTTYQPGALQRGSTTFVPASVLANFFGLTYSVTNMSEGYLVWLRRPDFGLTPEQFASAASYLIRPQYEAYLAAASQQSSRPGTTEGSGAAARGQLYLCMEAGENATLMLTALDMAGAKATFFCSQTFLEEEGALLRRMVATGHAVGLMADATLETSVEEQLAQANLALQRATCGKTRFISIVGGSEEDLASAQALGYYCLRPTLDYAQTGLTTASQAQRILKRVAGSGNPGVLWLGGNVNSAGLQALLSGAGEIRCFALRETV